MSLAIRNHEERNNKINIKKKIHMEKLKGEYKLSNMWKYLRSQMKIEILSVTVSAENKDIRTNYIKGITDKT